MLLFQNTAIFTVTSRYPPTLCVRMEDRHEKQEARCAGLFIKCAVDLKNIHLKKSKKIPGFFPLQNAELGQVPNYEHDESLYLYKREQMSYNVEDRDRVDNKYKLPNRSELLRPEFHHPSSRYQSSLMFRKDKE